jgi:hypothetical protein
MSFCKPHDTNSLNIYQNKKLRHTKMLEKSETHIYIHNNFPISVSVLRRMKRSNRHAITVTLCTFPSLLFKKHLLLLEFPWKHIISIAEMPNTGKFNLLKPRGFFTYRQVEHSNILHDGHFALSVLYGSQYRQRLLLYSALTDWFYNHVEN